MSSSGSGSHPAIEAALSKFGDAIDGVRQDLYYCDVAFMQKKSRKLRQNIRASAYVHLAAAVEVLVNETFLGVVGEINALVGKLSDLRLSLFAIASGSSFDSLADLRGLKNWHRRCQILSDIESHAIFRLDESCLPLDGRTIRPEHLDAAWKVFGFDGPSLPSPLHALALRDLADSRNSVAHGSEALSVVAGRKTPDDMFRLINRVEEIAIHLWGAAVQYLDTTQYRR
jgi:hypothetical protein